MLIKNCLYCNKKFTTTSLIRLYCDNDCKYQSAKLRYGNKYYQQSKLNGTFKSTSLLKQRFRILERDGFKCVYCGRKPNKDNDVTLQIDHILPRVKNGEQLDDNLVTACWDCNIGKSDVLIDKRKLRL
jgi:5-methylcytosine-specific restriction endonuclease McrA